MELTDILSLVKAGYTREEIEQMEKPQPSDPNSVPTVTPVATPVPVAEPANPPTQVVEPVAVAKPVAVPLPGHEQEQMEVTKATLDDIMKGIAKLTSAVQANAIAQSVIPAGVSNPPSAEDMLAEIIRPTFHQRGE